MKENAIAFDMDNTLCTSIRRFHPEDILKVKPKKCTSNTKYEYWIDILNELKRKGYYIIIFTRRNACGKNARNLTKKWLKKYNVKYDKLITNKPHYNLFIGDRLFSAYQGFITPEIIEGYLKFVNKDIKKHTYKTRKNK